MMAFVVLCVRGGVFCGDCRTGGGIGIGRAYVLQLGRYSVRSDLDRELSDRSTRF